MSFRRKNRGEKAISESCAHETGEVGITGAGAELRYQKKAQHDLFFYDRVSWA